jgi:phosphate-selective porin OprO/OprP
MKVYWDPNFGTTFETANGDFRSHVGFRFQLDSVFWNQNRNLEPASQIGDLQDGAFFRRVRPRWDGVAYGIMEWDCELALEQVQNSVPNLDEVWVGLKDLPVIGTIRAGHIKVPQGLEGDLTSSSKAMTFLERAAYTDAFYDNFATGIWTGNNILNQHLTWAGAVYRQDNPRTNSGVDFGDGSYGYSGRMTFLPIDECEGRHLLHLGISYSWRKAEKADPGLVGPDLVRLRARPEMRDSIGDFAQSNTPALPGNNARLVDTGSLPGDSTGVIGTELFYVLGPFSLQAEWAMCYLNNVVTGSGKTFLDKTRSFNGGYVQLSYFLTGENRAYDRRLGRLWSNYIIKPFTNFWGVRTDQGLSFGVGAWELAGRWSYLNLNDGVIRGGVLDGVELGVNWYLNTNLKLQFEYMHNSRYDKDPATPQGGIPGNVNAFGTRLQFFF